MSDSTEPAFPALTASLRASHERLRDHCAGMDGAALRGRSYATEWSIAQVLSHLGSGAEIFGLLLRAGSAGEDAPGPDQMKSIWAAWDAKSPEEQGRDALTADRAFLDSLEDAADTDLESWHLSAMGRSIDLPTLARMRLAEHALHTWDIDVALNPRATVPATAVALLVDQLGMIAERTGRADAGPLRAHIITTDPDREYLLEVAGGVSLSASGDASGDEIQLRLPAEALVRLVYGRLDPEHTPPGTVGDLDPVRRVFPGP